MGKPKVYIYVPVDQSGESYKLMEEAGCELQIEEGGGDIYDKGSNDFMIRPDADSTVISGVAAKRFPITKEIMEKTPNLRLIAMYTVGYDNVDMDAATDKGILITHCPTEANWGGVAEGTMANMLALLKRVRERDRYVKQGGRLPGYHHWYHRPRTHRGASGRSVGALACAYYRVRSLHRRLEVYSSRR